MGPRFLKALIPAEGASPSLAPRAFCAYNEACVENAACAGTSSAVATARQAVASILFKSGGSFYICTGGLLADTAGSQTPFFLTANHCISKGREAASLETYFDYVTTCSSPNCSQPYSNVGDTVGATLLSHASNTDHSLLQLSSNPVTPDGTVAYLGWNSSAVAFTNGFDLFRVSHPSGAPQAYSEHSVDPGAQTSGTLPRGNFIYSRDTFGATEGGSSGSPVVDGTGKVVGQLYGACGFNVGDVCDADSNATVDGAFAAYFGSVAQWLDSDGGPTCSPAGASCTSNSECCSNNCKGRAGAKTCK
jgi:V8-like Glu-specific endopeptidase